MRRIQIQATLLLTLLVLVAGALALVVSSASASRPTEPVKGPAAQIIPPPPAGGYTSTTDGPSSNTGKPAPSQPQLPAMPVGTPCGISTTIQGTLAAGDGTIPGGRLFRDAIPSVCGTPKTFPGTSGTGPFYYDAYTFTNNSGASQCVTASLFSAACNVELSVYLTSFDPNNVATNYLADAGSSTGAGGTVSAGFTIPAGADFVVVVNDPNSGLVGCGAYTLAVGGCPAGGTPTPTVTGTPPTATQTRTATQTPSPTRTATATATVNPCLIYTAVAGTATIVPGTVNTGSACDDCDTAITLPFPFTLYGQVFNSVNASSNGKLEFGTVNEPGGYSNTCLPAAPNVGPYDYTIFAHWDDLLTTGATDGIFTSVSGVAPNRIFNIEWRTTYFSGTGTANFEVRLYEGSTRFDLVYGALAGGGTSATTGVQGLNNTFTQYSCNTGLTSGLLVTFTQPPCVTPTVGPSLTPTAPPTVTRTATSIVSPTRTAPAVSSTATTTVTPTSCPLTFVDVPVGSTFYANIRCLACRGIVSGYPCGGPGEPCPGNYFRPNNNVTRGQTAKIVSESAGFNNVIPSTQQTFEDVPPGSTFYLWIERLSGRGIISGYPCGGPFESCVAPNNRPYFRAGNNVTRGQLSKITSGAAGWTETPTSQTFEDAPPGSTFYVYIERMASRGIIQGYACGGPFEPCVAPGNRPYFRPNNNATRGQMSKIAASAFFPNCSTPAAAPSSGKR